MKKLSRKDIEMLEVLATTTESDDKLADYIYHRQKAALAYKLFREAVVNGEGAKATEEKSPNELRAEIIEKAKEFVSKNSNKNHVMSKGIAAICFTGIDFTDVLNFVVNDEKRTVVALIKGRGTGTLYARGIAKCHPDDVFNEHIGKAIALGRALGKDVSEFENAVQPSELVVGMVIRRNYFNSTDTYEEEIEKIEGEVFHYAGGCYDLRISDVDNLTIIDDTNAQYGGIE